MTLEEFYNKTGLSEATPFTHDDIGKDTDIRRAIRTLMDGKLKVGCSSPYSENLQDFYTLDQVFKNEGTSADDIRTLIDLDAFLLDIWVSVSRHCACGNPTAMLYLLADELERMHADTTGLIDEKWQRYMQYELDRNGFTDHGSCISGAWITENGWAFMLICRLLRCDA